MSSDQRPSPPKGDRIEIESLVSHRDEKPYVRIKWGEQHGQLTPAEAIAHAMKVIEASQAAITDAFLFRFLLERVETDTPHALAVLNDFRQYRMVLEESGHAS